ncbi:MAG: hypothetical protein P4L27_15035 [Ignavibacteriaceae bacterium]|nr:hypothetical protein [Ignavibacteriaceae bacterium]
MNQLQEYNVTNWSNYNYNSDEICHEIQEILSEYPIGITRQNIIVHYQSYPHNILKGFLMSMIWGHGYDNRGPWKVSKMLTDFPAAIEILNNAANAVVDQDLIRAHKSFRNMQKIRVNYFSKYLYFLGRGRNINRYPLIFDNRVASSICRLHDTNSDWFNLFNIQSNTDAESYLSYNNLLHQQSDELNIEAEKIEYFLYLGIF